MVAGARRALAAALLLATGSGASAAPCGAGELTLPGSATCLRLGGVVRAEAARAPAAIVPAAPDGGGRRRSGAGLQAGARVDLDARVPTSFGPLRAYMGVGTEGFGRR